MVITITISQIISMTDALRPNRFDTELKISWLSQLDGRIFNEIFKTHENCPITDFQPYDSISRELLVPFPYGAELYSFYLQSRQDYENGEMNRYNQSAAMFNSLFEQFRNQYNRENCPKTQGSFKIRGEEICQVSPL